MWGKLSAVLTFTCDLLFNIVLSSLAYAIVSVDSGIKYITKEMLTSKHDCLYGQIGTYCKWFKPVFYEDFDYLKIPKTLSGYKYLNSKFH